MLDVKNLHYERDDSTLITPLSFSLQPGGFLYIAGDNGAGKTTLLKLLAGILTPTSGHIFWNQQSIKDNAEFFYQQINYIGHKSAITLPFTPEENLYFASRAYSLKTSISDALSAVGLLHKAHIPAAHLSAGQVRRIALAKLMLLDTPLWLLDEPYTALDKSGVAWLQDHIHTHIKRGGMVIMTSHQACGIQSDHAQEIIL